MNQPVRILITLLAACLVLFGWLWLEGRTGRSGAAQPFPGETVLLAAYKISARRFESVDV